MNNATPLILEFIRMTIYTLYATRCTLAAIITYSRIHPFMQNKANFRNEKMNITIDITNKYKNLNRFERPKNKANSNPIKPKTNPIQTQFNPIQSQFKANLELSSIE